MTKLSFFDLNDRHLGETIYIIGASPQLNDLSSSDIKALESLITIGVNRTSYKVESTYYLSTYIDLILQAQQRTHKPIFLHMRNVYEPPLIPDIIPLKKIWNISPEDALQRYFKRPEPTIYDGFNVAVAATHLAFIMGAARIVYIGVEQRSGLHFFHSDDEIKAQMRTDLEKIEDVPFLTIDHKSFSYDILLRIVGEKAEKAAARPFHTSELTGIFRACFKILRTHGIEIYCTIEDSVIVDAGGDYKPLHEFLVGSNNSPFTQLNSLKVKADTQSLTKSENTLYRNPKRVIEPIEKALQISPHNPPLYFMLLRAYSEAIELEPNNPDLYHGLGKAQHQQGNVEAAIITYQKAIELNSKQPEVYKNLGDSLKDCEQLEEAIAAYTQGIKLQPNYPEIYTCLGNAQLKKGDLETAISNFQKALKLDPTSNEAYKNLGDSLTKLRRLDEAIKAYQQAINYEPNNEHIYWKLATLQRQQGDESGAIFSYQKLLEIAPKNVLICITLGNIKSKLGQFEEALIYFDRALKLNPKKYGTYIALGNTLYQLEKFEEAVKIFSEAIELEPDRTAAHNGLNKSRRSLELNP